MAMAPGQGAPQEGQAQDQAQQGQGDGVGKLIDGIHSGLSDLSGIFAKSPVPDEFKQRLGELVQGFESLIQEMSQGPAPQGASNPVPAEAGAGPNVKPAM